MTRQKSFKRLVRARMEKTGESYTAARASLLAAEEPTATDGAGARDVGRGDPRAGPGAAGRSGSTCSTSGARPSDRTARSRAGSPSEQGIEPLAWDAQAVTVSYERARGAARRRRARRRLRDHRLEDRGGAGRAALRRVRRRVAARALAAGRRAARAHRHRGRGRPASTGATARPGSTSPSTRRARRRARVGARARAARRRRARPSG